MPGPRSRPAERRAARARSAARRVRGGRRAGRAVTETFKYLTDADAAMAEELILGQLAGKTFPQVLRLAEQAALTVDPGLAERRREESQRRDARVSFFRELSGTAGLAGRDLPPDEALAAMASVNARAEEYKDSDAFGDTRMDVLRAQAYLDLLNSVPAHARIANAEPADDATDAAEALAWAEARAARAKTQARDDARHAGRSGRAGDSADKPDGGGPGPVDPGPGPGAAPAGLAFQPRPADLIVPLATLLGLAERPGEVQGFGLLDPSLARELAAAAAASPRTEVCVTVTSFEGYAVGHGCARPERRSRAERTATTPGGCPPGTARPVEPDDPGRRPARPRRRSWPRWPVGVHTARRPGPSGQDGAWSPARRRRHLDADPPRRPAIHRAARLVAHLRVRPPVRDARLPAE